MSLDSIGNIADGGTVAPIPALVRPRLSVVVPARDEAAALPTLVAELRAALAGLRPFEILVVDDGSRDGTLSALRVVAGGDLRVLRSEAGHGQSSAMIAGIRAARADLVATIDADGQNDPADLARLVDTFMAQGDRRGVLVIGWRQRRADGRWRAFVSRIANATRITVAGDAAPDSGCGLRVFRRAEALRLPLFDHAHRFLPSLYAIAGGQVISVPVADRPRRTGASHYGTLGRLLSGLIDLAGVLWLRRRAIAHDDYRPVDGSGR